MKYLLYSLVVIHLAASASGDEPIVALEDFTSAAANESVQAYKERVLFLQQSMESHRQSAEETLHASLQDALRQAAADGDLEEVERLTVFMKKRLSDSKDRPTSSSDKERFRQAIAERARLKKSLDAHKEAVSFLPTNSPTLVRSIGGNHYLLKKHAGGLRRYRFNVDGTFDIAGKAAGRWAPIDNQTIFLFGGESLVHMWKFSSDWRSVAECFVGNGELTRVKQTAQQAR